MLKLTESAIGMLVSQYRAVLKNMRVKGAALALAGCLFLAPSSVAMAEDIVDPDDHTPRQNIFGIADSLAPSGSAGGVSASITGNTITVTSGSISGAVFGAVNFISSAIVSYNTVIVEDGEILSGIVGGLAARIDGAGAATASNNTVQISGGTFNGIYIPLYYLPGEEPGEESGEGLGITTGPIGGLAVSMNGAGAATANNNTVEISGGTFEGTAELNSDCDVAGGMAFSELSAATASNNTVTISGGTFDKSDVTGGMAGSMNGTATANYNKIYLSEDDSAVVFDNLAYFTGGSASSYSDAAIASFNEVEIKGGSLTSYRTETGDIIIGGEAMSEAGSATASNNKVTITDNAVLDLSDNITGGVARWISINSDIVATANSNTVTIEGSTITINANNPDGSVNGGFAESYGTATANNNTVIINESTIDNQSGIHGGRAHSAEAAIANKNTITLTETTIMQGGVSGGVANTYGTATANDNTINITDSEVSYGSVFAADIYGESGPVTATNNTVNISGSTINGEVRGAGGESAAGAATATNNIVNISSGTISGEIAGADIYSETGAVTANYNKVNITKSETGDITVNNDVIGGFAESYSGTTIANYNTIDITGATINIAEAIQGGGAWSAAEGAATADNNTVTITNSEVTGGDIIEGGYAYSDADAATVTNNTVNINGGTITSNIAGGYADSDTGSVTATHNTVTISDGTITGNVAGGYADSDTGTAIANKNTVTINGGIITGKIAGGVAGSYTGTDTATANENIITINGGTITGNVAGGNAESDTSTAAANNNNVTITNNSITGDITGGYAYSYSDTATATYNNVTITNSTIDGDIAGGYVESSTGTATYNTVTINGGTVTGTVSGGKDNSMSSGDVFTGNTLTVNSGGVSIDNVENFETVIFNYSGEAGINNLDTTVRTGISLFALFSDEPSGVTLRTNGNSVKFDGQISGGDDLIKDGAGTLTLTNSANDYSGGTFINNGTIIVGGDNALGTGDVTVNSGGLTIGDGITLDANETVTFASGTTLGVGNSSTISVDNLNIGTNVSLDIQGTEAATIHSNNSAFGNTFNVKVAGVEYTNTPSLDNFISVVLTQESNEISFTTGLVWNGETFAHGTFKVDSQFTLTEELEDKTDDKAPLSVLGDWNGETLTKTGAGILTLTGENTYSGGTIIEDGTIIAGNNSALGEGNVIMANNTTLGLAGGIELSIDNIEINGSNANFLVANSDTATISSVISENSTGGLTKIGTGTLTLSGANTYTGLTELREGTLTLSDAGTISDKLSLYGGTFFNTAGIGDTGVIGVTSFSQINVYGSDITWTGNLFMEGQTMNFYLPGTTEAGATMLTVNGTADITDSIVKVGIQGGSSLLQKEDSVVLIAADTLDGAPTNTTSNGHGMQGVTLRYEFDIARGIEEDENKLIATVTGVGTTDQSKSLSEGKLSGLISVNQGQDFIADQGIGNAVQSARGQGTTPFAAVGYGNTRHKTGSHVDSDGWSMVIGVAKENPNNGTTYGFFLEGGRGNYDTFNSFASGDVNGSGKNSYFGGGVLLRSNGQDNGSGYNYHEGSLRVGKVTTDFSSNIAGLGYGDTKSTYYGAHYGFGQVKKQSSGATRDLYGKLFYTHQGGDSITLNDGNHMDFSSAQSLRARLGVLFTTAPSASGTSFSYGLAYEHEFDGKQDATINTVAVDAPDMKGGSAIGTIGLTHQKAGSNFSMGLDLNGYVGKRQGLGVNAKFKWAF